jgi:hypothetical protein
MSKTERQRTAAMWYKTCDVMNLKIILIIGLAEIAILTILSIKRQPDYGLFRVD